MIFSFLVAHRTEKKNLGCEAGTVDLRLPQGDRVLGRDRGKDRDGQEVAIV